MEQRPPPVPSIGEAEDRLAWIFGSSRSGSTWLLRMLVRRSTASRPSTTPTSATTSASGDPSRWRGPRPSTRPTSTTLDRVKHDKDSYFFSDRYRDAWAPALRRAHRRPVRRPGPRPGRRRRRRVPEPLVVVKEPGSHVADLLVSTVPRRRGSCSCCATAATSSTRGWPRTAKRSWALDEGAFPVTDAGREALVRWQSAVWSFRTEVVQQVFAAPPRRPPRAGPLRGPGGRSRPRAGPHLHLPGDRRHRRPRWRTWPPSTPIAAVPAAAERGEHQGDPLGLAPAAGATT